MKDALSDTHDDIRPYTARKHKLFLSTLTYPPEMRYLVSNDGFYQFPDFMQAVYGDIHDWLDSREDTVEFRTVPTDIDAQDLRGIGKLFHEFFPTHFFKVACCLEELISLSTLNSWIQNSGKLCVLDVGCGSGVASCALIDAIARVIEKHEIRHVVQIHFIGVDPTRAALEIYRGVIHRVSNSDKIPNNLKVSFEIVCDKILEGALEVQSRLHKLIDGWDQPSIPRTLLLQVNVLRPLAKQMSDVAKAYHQIFTSTPMDWIHCLTIGTRGWENKVQNMKYFIDQHFSVHNVESLRLNSHVRFVNPPCSMYRSRGRKTHTAGFHATYASINSAAWLNDETWLMTIEPDNIMLAWARARVKLLRDSLADEAEIRLFDCDVPKFIGRLQRRLAVYAEDLFRPEEQIHYELPKNAESFRPKNLSRFEEEILSVALIQVAGDNFLRDRNIYAFRLNHVSGRKSEYLYQYFGFGYEEWIREARRAAESAPDGVVIRTDLSSYYTRISQIELTEILRTDMRVESERVKWLLRRIFQKHLDPKYHQMGYGLSQGGVGSGYYANIYVREIDEFFVGENPFNVSYHRYADDILIIVPANESAEEVLATLDRLLTELELERSQDKTCIFKCTDFDDHVKSGLSRELSALNLRFNTVLKQLWLVACCYHVQLNINDDKLCDFLRHYGQALAALGVMVPVPMLRRILKKYLFTDAQSPYVRLPDFDTRVDPNDWATSFRELNQEWMRKLKSLQNEFRKIALPILESLTNISESISREDSTRLRFCISRLCRIGFPDEVLSLLHDLLKRAPHVLREPAYVVDSLSIRGHENIINDLYHHFSHVDRENAYMRAMSLRAMRHCQSALEDILVDTVTNEQESIDVRLMASETLLANQTRVLGDQNWANLNSTLANEELYPQLRKNLLLLLRQVRDIDSLIYKPQPSDDPILHDAFEVEDGYSVFEQAEPPELEDFYDVDFPDDAYEYGEQVTVKSY